jgi:hypothetical protein
MQQFACVGKRNLKPGDDRSNALSRLVGADHESALLVGGGNQSLLPDVR